ncbi:MAG TPA: glycosyltransferase [Lysobacter sp.]
MKPQLFHGVVAGTYTTSPDHVYLDEGIGLPEGPNVGRNGEHLTISFLSMNRSALSVRLCRSIAEHIPNFQGEVLVMDNGSSEDELSALEEALREMPYRWRVVRLGSNFGVAGGRNRTMEHVCTSWLMTLDNDIYLLSNPIPRIQQDLARLGCHFMALLLLAEDGKTTQIQGGTLNLTRIGGDLLLGCGTAYAPQPVDDEEPPAFLGTFLPGGAAVLRCDSFRALGGYDEGMFVGFEDVEFSLRLFRSGMKVGASNTAAFVHDHPPPASANDKDYEHARFARQRLEESAAHFEAKHGYKVWHGGVESWLEKRERDLGLSGSRAGSRGTTAAPSRRRVALVVDSYGWALSNIADQLVRHLSDEFEFDIVSSGDVAHPSMIPQVVHDSELVHFLWREPLNMIFQEAGSHYLQVMFGGWEAFQAQCLDSRTFTATVFDHLFLEDDEVQAREYLYSRVLAGYTVSSQKLMDVYSAIPGYSAPSAVTQDGVDLERFTPRNLARLAEFGSRPLRVGWAGNSAFGHWSEKGAREDLKGFHTMLRPAIERLRAEGIAIDEHYADKQIRSIPHHRMNEYYQDIDLLVCCSLTEGTPNPVLEAMACGVPVISTDVGIVPEVFGPRQREFMMAARSVETLKALIARMVSTQGLATALSAENIAQVQPWSWAVKAQNYRTFFRSVLNKHTRAA